MAKTKGPFQAARVKVIIYWIQDKLLRDSYESKFWAFYCCTLFMQKVSEVICHTWCSKKGPTNVFLSPNHAWIVKNLQLIRFSHMARAVYFNARNRGLRQICFIPLHMLLKNKFAVVRSIKTFFVYFLELPSCNILFIVL